VQAEASPFAAAFAGTSPAPDREGETIATAIKIGDPPRQDQAVHSIRNPGVVTPVTDGEILRPAVIDAAGVGCSPSAASVAAPGNWFGGA
jgi:threonine synthase